MKIKYLGHSGFLLECDEIVLIFDYYTGDIPEIGLDKKVYIFVSHFHQDHYNKEIFKIYPNNVKKYIISKTCKTENDVLFVKPYMNFVIDSISVKTYNSTDEGVSFVIKYKDYCIYHAGDLNAWCFPDDTKAEYNNMEALYKKYIDEIDESLFDIAFIPLDPRLEECSIKGIDDFLKIHKVNHLFPMHMWNNYDLILKYRKEYNLININQINDYYEVIK